MLLMVINGFPVKHLVKFSISDCQVWNGVFVDPIEAVLLLVPSLGRVHGISGEGGQPENKFGKLKPYISYIYILVIYIYYIYI